MKRHLTWMVAALATTLAASLPAAALPGCMQPVEYSADRLRSVQVQLNVAALVCRGRERAELPGYYNAFIVMNRQHLIGSVPAMERLARRQGISLDTYLTRIFNRISLESYRTPHFCAQTLAALKQAVSSPDPLDMLPLLPVVYVAPDNTCNLPSTAVAAGAMSRTARE